MAPDIIQRVFRILASSSFFIPFFFGWQIFQADAEASTCCFEPQLSFHLEIAYTSDTGESE